MDTETALALLEDRFTSEGYSREALLDALVDADGDVARARARLLARPPKRRRIDLGTFFAPSQPISKPPRNERVRAAPAPVDSAAPARRSIADVLKPQAQASSFKSAAPSLPPLTLATPELVARHSPCTLALNVLPAQLAADLLRYMVDVESPSWQSNRWYMVDREVVSPHTSSFYVRDKASWAAEGAKWWYNGRDDAQERAFPELMDEARRLLDPIVDEAVQSRSPRYAYEADTPWSANVAAANLYRGRNQSVGAHADQLTYLGPWPTIASISLGCQRTFRLRGGDPVRTYDIPLPHNSLLIMHAGCQEHFKHSVIPAPSLDVFRLADEPSRAFNERINITFRMYRKDFVPSEARPTPSCECGKPCLLRATPKHAAMHHWQCQAGHQAQGQSCRKFVPLDFQREGRGPCVGDRLRDALFR